MKKLFVLSLVILGVAAFGENRPSPFQLTTVSTISDLRGAIPANTASYSIWVDGYSSANDGGGGRFIYSSSSTATDDAGITIAPASGTGRWIRDLSEGRVRMQWFGAFPGDATADSSSCSTAISAATTRKLPAVFDGGQFIFSAAVSVPDYSHLIGLGSASVIATNTHNYPLFKISDDTTLHGLELVGVGSHTIPSGDADVSSYTHLEIIGDRNLVENCYLREINDYGILICREGNDNKIINCTIANTTSPPGGHRGRYGIAVSTVADSADPFTRTEISGCRFQNLSVAIACASDHLADGNTFYTDVDSIIIDGCQVASMSEHGIYLSSGQKHVITGNVLSACYSAGIKIRSRRVTIAGNACYECTGGIELGEISQFCTVTGNTIQMRWPAVNTTVGINLEGSSITYYASASTHFLASTMRGNVIEGNTIVMPSAETTYPNVGIRSLAGLASEVPYLEKNSIIGNTIIGFSTGIFLRYCRDYQVSENHLIGTKGNTAYIATSTYWYGSGILLETSISDIDITGNCISSFTHPGIMGPTVFAGVNNNISFNSIYSCASYGIDVERTTTGGPVSFYNSNTLVGNYGSQYRPESSSNRYNNIRPWDGSLSSDQCRYSAAFDATATPTARGQLYITATAAYVATGTTPSTGWLRIAP